MQLLRQQQGRPLHGDEKTLLDTGTGTFDTAARILT
jgi:hypothetical protein